MSVVAQYKLNENAANTNVTDSAGVQSTATSSQNTSAMTITGKISRGFAFNGTTDFVNIPHHASQLLTSGFSICAWIRPNSVGENSAGYIVDKSNGANTALDGFKFQMATTNRLQARINAGTSIMSNNNSITIDGTTWTHVILTVASDGTCTFYVNNVLNGTPAISAACSGITTTTDMRIGNRTGATDRTFDGGIDDVRIYNTVLTADERAFIYNGGNGTESPLNLMSATVGTFTLTGVNAALKRLYNAVAAAGSFVLTGVNVLFSLAGHTQFTKEAKPTTTFSKQSKPTTSHTPESKPTTIFSKELKP